MIKALKTLALLNKGCRNLYDEDSQQRTTNSSGFHLAITFQVPGGAD